MSAKPLVISHTVPLFQVLYRAFCARVEFSTVNVCVFAHCSSRTCGGVLIYVFDVGAGSGNGGGGSGMGSGSSGDGGAGGMKDGLGYFLEFVEALEKYSPNAKVFVLVHKMDLVQKTRRTSVLEKKAKELAGKGPNGSEVTIFGTSIYDESLYKVRLVISV